MNTETPSTVPLLEALEDTRDLLRATTLPLATASAPQQREDAARAVAQLEDYVLPRVRSLLDALAPLAAMGAAMSPRPATAPTTPPVKRCTCTSPTTRAGAWRSRATRD